MNGNLYWFFQNGPDNSTTPIDRVRALGWNIGSSTNSSFHNAFNDRYFDLLQPDPFTNILNRMQNIDNFATKYGYLGTPENAPVEAAEFTGSEMIDIEQGFGPWEVAGHVLAGDAEYTSSAVDNILANTIGAIEAAQEYWPSVEQIIQYGWVIPSGTTTFSDLQPQTDELINLVTANQTRIDGFKKLDALVVVAYVRGLPINPNDPLEEGDLFVKLRNNFRISYEWHRRWARDACTECRRIADNIGVDKVIALLSNRVFSGSSFFHQQLVPQEDIIFDAVYGGIIDGIVDANETIGGWKGQSNSPDIDALEPVLKYVNNKIITNNQQFSTGWKHKAKLTLPASKVGSEDVNDFTLEITDAMLSSNIIESFKNKSHKLGFDIRVSTDENGDNLLNTRAVEFGYNQSEGYRILAGPTSLSSSEDNEFWIWWGNKHSTPQPGEPFDDRWTDLYTMDSQRSIVERDKAFDDVNTLAGGGVNFLDDFSISPIGTALDFTGRGDVSASTLPEPIGTDPVEGAQRTIILLAKPVTPDDGQNVTMEMFDIGDNTAVEGGALEFDIEFGNNRLSISSGGPSGQSASLRSQNDDVTFDEWGVFAVTFGAHQVSQTQTLITTFNDGKLFIDGNELGNAVLQNGSLQLQTTDGANAANRFFRNTNAIIGSLEFHDVERSPSWVQTRSNNLLEPSTFMTSGPIQEANPPEDGLFTLSNSELYRRLSTDYGNAFNKLRDGVQYLEDALTTVINIDEPDVKMDLLQTFRKVWERNSSNPYESLFPAARQLNSFITLRTPYNTVNDFLDATDTEVTEYWADLSAKSGVVIDPIHILEGNENISVEQGQIAFPFGK